MSIPCIEIRDRCKIPGQTYIERLPGRSRLAFVRERPINVERSSFLDTAAIQHFESSGPVCVSQGSKKMPRWWRSLWGSDESWRTTTRRTVYVHPQDSHYPIGSSRGRVATTTQQTCSACGKFRSPSWSARHPLRLGESPRANICRRCADKSTSSEDTPRRHRKRKHHRRYRDSSSYDDSFSSADLRKFLRKRHRSDSLTYIKPRHLARARSSEGVNIVIQNHAGERKPRVRTLSSSDESIRVTRRLSFERLRPQRASSVEEELVREHYLPRRRSLSRARRRSASSVHFEDEVDRVRYRRRSRSRSSRDSPYDDPVEEFIVSRPHSKLRRRRPMFFDGIFDRRTESQDQNLPPEKPSVSSGTKNKERERVSEKSHASIVPEKSFSVSQIKHDSNGHGIKSRGVSSSRSSHKSHGNHGSPSGSRDKSSHSFPMDRSSPILESDIAGERYIPQFACDYEVDSQFPSPPRVTYARPVLQQSRSKAKPPSLQVPSKRRSASYTEEGYKDIATSPISRDTYFDPPVADFHDWSAAAAGSSPSTLDWKPEALFEDPFNAQPSTFVSTDMTPEHPDHPDHLAYLLSTAQITPVMGSDGRDRYEYTHGDRYGSRYGYASQPGSPPPPPSPWHSYPSSFENNTALPPTPDPVSVYGNPDEPPCDAYTTGKSENKQDNPYWDWEWKTDDKSEADVDYVAEGRKWMEERRQQRQAERK